jgi:hypothetical protein
MAEDERGIGGRKPTPLVWTIKTYKDKNYYTCKTLKRDRSNGVFVIDADDYEKVKERSWHCMKNGYVGSAYRSEGKCKTLYLHNLIMNRLTFDGKGQTESVDHINGIGTDNRKANLRICSQSQQNRNRSKRERTTTRLPEGIVPDELPQNVWYMPPNGSHGERFAVEIKGIPDTPDIVWRSTASKTISSREKLISAIAKRKELYESMESLRVHERKSELSKSLQSEYDEIMKME